jgi:pimeloyl-ACP methyl ester carboxylesterase
MGTMSVSSSQTFGTPVAPDRPQGRQHLTRAGWRHVSSRDGTAIGWCRTDPPRRPVAPHRTAVVLCNGIACSVGYWTPLAERLGRDRPVVQWDYRGHGISAVPDDVSAVTMADVLDDLEAVLAAGGVPGGVFVGHSFGVQVALEAARRWPERVDAIVAAAGSAGAPFPAGATQPPFGVLNMLERFHTRRPNRVDRAWHRWWQSRAAHLAARAIGGTSLAAPQHAMLEYYEHVSTRDVAMLLAMIRSMQSHDARDVVQTLPVPLLALAGAADRLTPLPIMSALALHAPHGELAVCHGGTHTLPAEHPDWVLDQLCPLLEHIDASGTTPQALRHLATVDGCVIPRWR